jgi:hypothetical protein
MSYRRVLTVLFLLAVATLACSPLGPSITSVAPTSAPATNAVASKTPINFHNGGVTPEAATDVPADTQVPATKAPKPTATKGAKPTATKAAKPTATEQAQPASCDTFQASTDVYWVTLDSNGKVDQTVTDYPDGATEIVPVFEYDCNPKAFQLVTIFSFNGQQVFSDKTTLKATDQHDLFGYPLVTKSGGAIDNGEWGVEFYNAKTLVASGKVAVGGGGSGNGNGNGNDNGNQSSSSTVTVQGTITNKSGGKPIAGAVFVVLNEGITIDQFVKDNYADKDIFTGAKSDSSGQFTLPDQVKRNTDYSIMVAAKGFKAVAIDGFNIDDSQPDPLVLDVTLSK